jgi:hypothetical protein
MAKSNKEKSLALGGALVGLLISGTAFGVTGNTTSDNGQFFKFNELKSGYQLAAAAEEEKEGEKHCAGTDDKGEKHCGEKEGKSCSGKDCGEGSCS